MKKKLGRKPAGRHPMSRNWAEEDELPCIYCNFVVPKMNMVEDRWCSVTCKFNHTKDRRLTRLEKLCKEMVPVLLKVYDLAEEKQLKLATKIILEKLQDELNSPELWGDYNQEMGRREDDESNRRK